MTKNIALFPWFKFCQSLLFWQATWFLYFQQELSAAEAILLYAVYDIGTTLFEVPSGYLSDRLGRRLTLAISAVAGFGGAVLLALGDGFMTFALGQVLLGVSAAFASGTDSAFLYESLAADGRQGEIEREELRAWRYAFVALAISAVVGGGMALYADTLPFVSGAIAFAVMLAISILFKEPPRDTGTPAQSGSRFALRSLGSAFTQPVLVWLFFITVLMYTYSHIPFVFGQPFILEALNKTGFQSDAPLVSGVVSATMMVVSVITSLFAPGIRDRLGLPGILLLAFGMQIALCGVLALTNDAIAITLLFLRMVPSSLSRPFVLARIQPLLKDDSRATYLSLQSFCGRLLFATSLMIASAGTTKTDPMPYVEIQQILGWYVLGGILCFAVLAAAARLRKIDG